MDVYVFCVCCVLSGRDLCIGLIARLDESYRVWCVWVWSWSLDNDEALVHWYCSAMETSAVDKVMFVLITAGLIVFFPIPPHVPYGLRGLSSRWWPKCNRLPWGAVTLSRWGGWWYMNMKYQEGPKTWILLNYPDRGRHGDLPLQGKISVAEPGIEPGTSWSVVRNSDH
jgi:hypothetical protein